MMWEDKIVAEVRAVRQAHAEKFGFDLGAIFEDLKQEERRSQRETLTFPPKPAVIVTKPKKKLTPSPV
jgi:hypothetical protein